MSSICLSDICSILLSGILVMKSGLGMYISLDFSMKDMSIMDDSSVFDCSSILLLNAFSIMDDTELPKRLLIMVVFLAANIINHSHPIYPHIEEIINTYHNLIKHILIK